MSKIRNREVVSPFTLDPSPPAHARKASPIPPEGRFPLVKNEQDGAGLGRLFMIAQMRRGEWPTEELQKAEFELSTHPRARRYGQDRFPSRALLKLLAAIRAELRDRGHPVTVYREREKLPWRTGSHLPQHETPYRNNPPGRYPKGQGYREALPGEITPPWLENATPSDENKER